MIVPSFFYGRYGEVRMRTERLVAKTAAGKTFKESLPDRRGIDTSTMTAGYFTLMTHNDISIVEPHFHFTLLAAAIAKSEGLCEGPLADRLFTELLAPEWGPLVFANPADGWIASNILIDKGEQRRAYIDSVHKHLRSLDREGCRYISQSGRLGNFWQANGALRQALREEGMSAEALEKGLTADIFRKFYRDWSR